ncbi:MAG: zf-HC2 domain-containing protein [Bacillaceae bacterium]|nr:zf-HC2 domain-containing protein [Bacillaceae bacterium]
MNNCKKQVVALIHKYLDEEITEREKKVLNEHLEMCDHCKKHLVELQKSIAFIQSSSHIQAPIDFTSQVMKQLPKQKKFMGWKKWAKNNPLLVAAAVFFMFIWISMLSVSNDQDIFVSGQGNVYIDKETKTVVIPEGEIIHGDLIVKNADLQVDGEISGNVKVLKGKHYQASAGVVSGEIEEINQTFDLIWYHIKSFFSEVINIGTEKNK